MPESPRRPIWWSLSDADDLDQARAAREWIARGRASRVTGDVALFRRMIDIANVPEEAESLIASLLAPEYQIEVAAKLSRGWDWRARPASRQSLHVPRGSRLKREPRATSQTGSS